jgi:mono/diheme cytochrome c family protein
MRPHALPWLGASVVLVVSVLSVIGPQATAQPTADPLAFDAPHKRLIARFGESNAVVSFTITNVSRSPVIIHDIVPSCGCSVATFPAKPWPLPSGARGVFSVATDVRGKSGSLLKTIVVQSSAGARQLTYQVDIQEPANSADRARNQTLAQADPKAIFNGDCARCHVAPARGLLGRERYDAACGICHDAAHRASMVPDLRTLKKPTPPREYWLPWIAHGKPGTLMPGFAIQSGGFLSDVQMETLAAYCASERPVWVMIGQKPRCSRPRAFRVFP